MIKVLVSALVGTLAGIIVMVAVIAISGTDTSGALPLSPSSPATSGGGTSGGGAAGQVVWDANGCGSCHTLAAAGATGAVGPNLDTALATDAGDIPLPDFVMESIVDPEKAIATGFSGGIMPATFGSLSQTDLDNLVALILQGQ